MGPYGDEDRTSVNEDGTVFYGYDNDDGWTTWYGEDGTCDSRSQTPADDDDDW